MGVRWFRINTATELPQRSDVSEPGRREGTCPQLGASYIILPPLPGSTKIIVKIRARFQETVYDRTKKQGAHFPSNRKKEMVHFHLKETSVTVTIEADDTQRNTNNVTATLSKLSSNSRQKYFIVANFSCLRVAWKCTM